MKMNLLPQTTRRVVRDSLLWVSLWLLAAHGPATVMAQGTDATSCTSTNIVRKDCGGGAERTGCAARFCCPEGVAVDGAGNVFVADSFNNTLRRITPAGGVTTVAGLAGHPGSADGTGSAARFHHPEGVALDSEGNLFVADRANNTIRKVTPAGLVTTLAGLAGHHGSADGAGSAARFYYPQDVAPDQAGNIYVADSGNNTIRKVTSEGVVTTFAGSGMPGEKDGTAGAAQFYNPRSVAVDRAGNVYVADRGNFTIRKVTPEGMVTTLAGLAGRDGHADGAADAARFWFPSGLAVDRAGNVYVADTHNSTIREISPAGVVTTLAGLAGSCGNTDGTRNTARFHYPKGLASDRSDNVYVADALNNTIRRVTPAGVVTTLAGLAGEEGSRDGTGSGQEASIPTLKAELFSVEKPGNLITAGH